MSFFDNLLLGAGVGLQRGGESYFDALERKRQRERQDQALVDQRMESVSRGMREQDELSERKRSNREQEKLEHERNVQGSMDRMLARENSLESILLRAQLAREQEAGRNQRATQHEEGVDDRSRRPRPRATSAENPDGLTQSQRDGVMLLNQYHHSNNAAEMQDKRDFEEAWRRARTAFPNAHPGDVAMAAKRYLDRVKQDKENRYR